MTESILMLLDSRHLVLLVTGFDKPVHFL